MAIQQLASTPTVHAALWWALYSDCLSCTLLWADSYGSEVDLSELTDPVSTRFARPDHRLWLRRRRRGTDHLCNCRPKLMSGKLPYVDIVVLLIDCTPIRANVLAALTHCQVVGATERSGAGEDRPVGA
jgi:hypothetical protein